MKKAKKFIAGMLAIACTFSTFALAGCDLEEIVEKVKAELPLEDDQTDAETPDDGADETPDDTDDGASEVPETPEEGTDDGSSDGADDEQTGGEISTTSTMQYLRSGGTYTFSNSVAFLSTDVVTTSTTDYEAVTSTLTATVEPIDADQRVDWTYEWVNASSTWATGKTLSDYMTIAPQSDGSVNLDVTCKKPFAEQIKIVCTSRANSNISAECIVEFLSLADLKTVTLGSDDRAITVNLGGETTIPFEDLGNKNYGGILAVGETVSDTNSVYTKVATVEDYEVFNFDLVQPAVYYDHSLKVYDGTAYNGTIDDGYLTATVEDILNFTLDMRTYYDDIGVYCQIGCKEFNTNGILDELLLSYKMSGSMFASIEKLSDCDEEDIVAILDTLSENSLYTLVLHVEVLGVTQTYYSLLKLNVI